MNVWLPLERPLLGTWPATQACVLMGNRSSDPLVRRPAALNPLSHSSQGSYSFLLLEYLSLHVNHISVLLIYLGSSELVYCEITKALGHKTFAIC